MDKTEAVQLHYEGIAIPDIARRLRTSAENVHHEIISYWYDDKLQDMANRAMRRGR